MEDKIYLDNGEILDFTKCTICNKAFEYIEEKNDSNKSSLASFLKEEFGDKLNIVRTKIRKCDCGCFSDMSVTSK